MSERNRPRVQRIPLWLTVTLAILGGVAVVVASQIYRYAHGTELVLWYVALGLPIAGNLAMAPVRQWLTDHYQRVRVDVEPDGPIRIPDNSQNDEMRQDRQDATRAKLLHSLDEYREPTEEKEGRDYIRINGRGAKIILPREDRTPEQYCEEVEQYVQASARYLMEVVAANYVRLGVGVIPLRVRSDTDGTLEGVRLRLWVDDEGAEIYDPEDIEFPEEAPQEIRRYGQSPPVLGNPFARGLDLSRLAVSTAPDLLTNS